LLRQITGLGVLAVLGWAVIGVWRMAPPAELVFQRVREGDHAALAAYVRAEPAVVGWRDPLGLTPLHWAASTGDDAAVRLLLGAGADPNARDVKERTPLHIAAMSQMRRGDGLMKTLIASGADVNAVDEGGATPLVLAQRLNRADLGQTLIAAGAVPSNDAPDTRVTAADGPSGRPMFAARRWARRAMGPRRAWIRFNGLSPQPAREHVDG
jgi:hypothetical protein